MFEKYTATVDKIEDVKSEFSTVFETGEAIADAQKPE